MEKEKDRSGGVYCKICKLCLSAPRKRKHFQKATTIVCEKCEIVCSNPALSNTDPKYHDPSIAKILRSYSCFNPGLHEELVIYLLEFKLGKREKDVPS